jgi:predicted Zn-dependent protease
VPRVRALLPRIAIAVVALLVVAWSAVLWRDDRIGSEASNRLLMSEQLTDAEWAREVERLRDAELLDPSTKWPLARAQAYLLRGHPRDAARLTESVLEREPENVEAWIVLREATREIDPRRAAQAGEEILRLSPPPAER